MTNTPLTTKLAETAELAAEKAREGLGAAADMTKDAAKAIKQEATARASETVETLREATSARVEDARETLVTTGERLARSLQDSAEDLDGLQSRVLSGLADGVTDATDRLRSHSPGDLLSQTRRFARDNPGLFAAGAALAGFALARFLRSSAEGKGGTSS